ncbi:MAG: CarD family transcriptional regulator [Parvibaculum sp.]|nr:CarD family transcriptional regulator [Parvibaculum sp.]
MAAKATKKTKTSAKKAAKTAAKAKAKTKPKAKTKVKAAAKKTATRKAAPTKAKAKPKAAAKKAIAKKTATKKATAKKTATKKAAPKKPAAKKAAPKTAAKKATAKKAAQKKPTAKKAAPKSAAKKAAPKSAAKKAAPKTAAKKATSKKAAKLEAVVEKKAPRTKPIIARPAKVDIPEPASIRPSPKADPKVTATPDPRPSKLEFKNKEFVVYPSHGVGQITSVERQEVAGHELELYVITFAKDKMTLRVPTNKSEAVGMRKLSEPKVITQAIDTLKGKAKVKRTMWSRRAQEYEAKINSGDLISIAEVVRDLFRSDKQPEQSYSERQLFEAAIDRMAREVAAADNMDDAAAIGRLETVLVTAAGKAEKKAEAEAAAEAAGEA